MRPSVGAPAFCLTILALLCTRCGSPNGRGTKRTTGGGAAAPRTASLRERIVGILAESELVHARELDLVLAENEKGHYARARELARDSYERRPTTDRLFTWYVASAIDAAKTPAMSATYDRQKTARLVKEERRSWARAEDAEPAVLVLLAFMAHGAAATAAAEELRSARRAVPSNAAFSAPAGGLAKLALQRGANRSSRRDLEWVLAAAAPGEGAVAIALREPKEPLGTVDVPSLRLVARVTAPESLAHVLVRVNDSEVHRVVPQATELALDHTVELFKGENRISILATDRAGRVAEKVLAVTRRALPPIDQRWAVIIGVSKYEHKGVQGLKDLRFADRDAQKLYQRLVSAGPHRWPEENVRLLVNEQATRAAVTEAILVFLKRAQPNDLALVFFSGHGAPETNNPGRNYFICHDTDPDKLVSTGFGMWQIGQALSAPRAGGSATIRARRVVVLADACHSGGCVPEGIKDIRGVTTYVAKGVRRLAAGTAVRRVLTSCKAGQVSQEKPQWGGGHGAFAWALIRGLDGDADERKQKNKNARGNQDGQVGLDELAYFVRREVADLTDGNQEVQDDGRLSDVIMRGD